MVEVKREELEDLKKLGSGKFGIVYKKDEETAYKIYFPSVADMCGFAHDNPALNLSRRRYKRLIDVSKRLKYTGGVLDTIKVDGHFGGVVIPYYSGETLDHMMNIPTEQKVELSNQMLRNCQELHRHFIYPIDFKLNNIIMDNDNVRLIDIDDIHTHVFHAPNLLYRAISINALSETIETFFKEYKHLYLPKSVNKELLREPCRLTLSHRSIEGYIERKSKKTNIIFVDLTTDLNVIKKLIREEDYKIVFVIPKMLKKEELLSIIDSFRSNGIDLYDFVREDMISDYLTAEDTIDPPKIYTKQKRD